MAGRYCGFDLPPSITPNSSTILIRFETDSSLEAKGFVLKYSISCGGTFTENTGIIRSPLYPDNYPPSKDCIYIISLPPGKSVVLNFEMMDIEEGASYENITSCLFDHLDVRDGDNENSTLLHSLCGSNENMPDEPVYSTQNYMFLEFISDAKISGQGFLINYTTVDRSK